MTRRSKGDFLQQQNLDSFLDIVTNSIGFLILVLTLTAVSSGSAKVNLGMPIMMDAEAGSEFHLMECRDDQVFIVEDSGARDAMGSFGLDAVARDYEAEFYRLEFSDQGSVVFRPIPGRRGADPRELTDPGSPFQSWTATLDPKTDWLLFAVRPSGFEAFRKARAAARERGLCGGWIPMAEDRPIIVNLNGQGRTPKKEQWVPK